MYINIGTYNINVNQKENFATVFVNVLETKSYLIVTGDTFALLVLLENFPTKRTKNVSF